MRDKPEMAMLVSDTECTATKVWQPWYIDESDGVRKALPTRALRDSRARERMILHKPSKRVHSPSPSSEEELDVGHNEVHLVHRGPHPYPYIVQEEAYDNDLPLDMSIKRRPSPTPIPPPAHSSTPPISILPISTHSSISSHHSNTPPPLQPPPAHTPANTSPPPYSSLTTSRGRPSVITCAPWFISPAPYDVSVLRPHENQHHNLPPSVALVSLSDECPQSPPTRPRFFSGALKEPTSPPKLGNDAEERRRHVVQAGPVDPEIDEHFRRSLGKNYQALFVSENLNNQQNQSNDSVDDHFTKALGATWTKIKAQKEKESPPPLSFVLNSSRVSSSSAPTISKNPVTSTSTSNSSSTPPPPALAPAPAHGLNLPPAALTLAKRTPASPRDLAAYSTIRAPNSSSSRLVVNVSNNKAKDSNISSISPTTSTFRVSSVHHQPVL